VSDPENGKVKVILRRRRSRRHRRNRAIRRLLFLTVLGVCAAGASVTALRHLDFSFLRDRSRERAAYQAALAREREAALDRIIAESHPSRPVYPYSLVPGGIDSGKELKLAAEHDPALAAHYAGFDYDHAWVVQLTLARSAFVSYRIGNHIYWMRRRISLHKGEKLITDGRITARGRCGNRVEEKPQQQAANSEPAPEAFDHPVQDGAGTATQAPPLPYDSSLMTRPQAPGFEPIAPLNSFGPFGGGNLISLSPPGLPEGVCEPVKKGSNSAEVLSEASLSGRKKVGPCGSGPSTVPEPGTWVMLVTGLGALAWQARRKFARG
jgi:nitroreductase